MPRQPQQKSPGMGINIKLVMKGIIISYLATIPIFVIFAFVLSNTLIPDKLISPAVLITTIISVLIAGIIAGRNLRSRGLINGIAVGILYMVILYLISSIVYRDFSINSYTLAMLVIGAVSGGIGGIIGVNIKASPYKKSYAKKSF